MGFLAVGLLALLLVVALADRTFFLPQAGLVKSPEVLADTAVQIAKGLGYDLPGKEHTQGFAVQREYLKRGSQHPPTAYFWYRAGGEQPVLPALLGEAPGGDSQPRRPDAVTLRLDGRGRLLAFAATSTGLLPGAEGTEPRDWSGIFALAGLDIKDFHAVPPVRQPPMYADRLAAWESGGEGGRPRVAAQGASLAGRVVFFQAGPTEELEPRSAAGIRPLLWRTPLQRIILNLVAVVAAASLAWYNFCTGRGDYRGAHRLALFILALGLGDWLLGEKHSAVLSDEAVSLYVWIARVLLTATIAWLCYFAIEPYVRKFWPQVMITWSHVLAGKFRDPLLGATS